ncbi:alpha-galactosidase [Salisediminibacterium halotolerans]|uniref:Alpha-galactosidase n=1 Tax=Salisediminibacterium halotolerans TaxID=517425 RepID=A0A1H9QNX5_9BACI|nr:alpha-galactosidase [Salisediminibacterium haloalkalitolerans]SER61453.1 alpha-galactosidase [Salisediminibacterium haloalkalitolerans]
MTIHFNEKTQEFHLTNGNISYIMAVLQNGQLGHLYYGRALHHRDSFQHLVRMQPRAGQSCVYEGDLAFSLDIIRQEYPSYGTTDYREPAFQLLQEDGSRTAAFSYRTHRITAGKPELDGLPATYTENEAEADTLEIVLEDDHLGAELILTYTIYAERDVITRSARFINHGRADLSLTRALSASIDFFDSSYEMVQLSGSWSRERHVVTRPLMNGIQKITSTRGTSSAQQNPFIALKRPNADEHQGEVFGFNFVYSGNFLAQVEVDHYDVARVSMGINPFDFRWLLTSGESFQAPEVVMVYSNEGLNGMSQTYHSLYRERLVRGQWRDQQRPVLLNNWEATYFDFDEAKLTAIAEEANQLGVELFVLDDGWFGRRDDDTTSLGDWYADEKKLPNGVAGAAEKITGRGMKFGLWFEPEMVNKESELYQEHPDWIIQVNGRAASHGRNQYVLDFSRQEVVDHLYEKMAAVLSGADVSYVKWDMNRYMTEIGSSALPAERQSEVAHRYILGVYQLYERLTAAFPHVLFESCASGGARFDPAMLYYAPQAWTSDNTDAVERLKIQYGTSIAYPLSAIGAHVSAVPNHQVHRETSLEMRGHVSYFGTFGYELDIREMSGPEKELVREQIRFYKNHRELIQKGVFYRLESPFEKDGNRVAWMVVSQDQKEALVGYYKVLAEPNPGFYRLFLQGLDPDTRYRLNGEASHYGDELMEAGLMLENEYSGSVPPLPDEKIGDFVSYLYHLQAETK